MISNTIPSENARQGSVSDLPTLKWDSKDEGKSAEEHAKAAKWENPCNLPINTLPFFILLTPTSECRPLFLDCVFSSRNLFSAHGTYGG